MLALLVSIGSAASPQTSPPTQVPAPQPFPLPPSQPGATDLEQQRRRRGEPPYQPVPGTERWSASVGASSPLPPVVTDSQVFIAVPPSTVAAFRIQDGREMWRVDLAADQPLAIADGRVFVAGGEAMHALDAEAGSVVWRQPTGTLTAPPLVHEGWVVLATEGGLVARRASDGTVVWQQQHGSLRLRPTIDGDTLYIPLVEPGVRAISLTDGKVTWERRLGGPPSEITALAGRVYVGSEDKYFYCLDADDGETDWRYRVGAAVIGRPAIDRERVYFGAMDNLVRALDRVSGALRWQSGLPFRPHAGPVLFGTAVLVPGAVSELPTFDAASGKPGRRVALPAPLAAPLVVRVADGGPVAAGITGSLDVEWKLSVWEQAMTIPVAPLSVLPGKPVPIPQPPPPGPAAP